MTQQYWLRGPAGQSGPLDQLQIRGLVAIGQLTPLMEISADGTNWQSAGTVAGLIPKAIPPIPLSAPLSNTEQPSVTAPTLPAPSPEPSNSRFKNMAAAIVPCLALAGLAIRYFHTYQAGGIGAVIDLSWPIIACLVGLGLLAALASYLMTKPSFSRWWADVSSRGPLAWLIKHI